MSVLFLNDWKKFPKAMIHYNTKNESFKRMVSVYNSMGIKNCFFPLLLLQPELQDVDPHSENLTEEQKILIGLECKYNIWYYLREVVRIPPVAGPEPVCFKANRGNIALSWCFMASVDVALIQPRQTGKSVSTDCLMVWLLFIALDNSILNMITKDNKLRTANIERLKKIRDLLPPYLVPKHKADSDNQNEITCKSLNNSYMTGVAQNSESSANNLGRGLTSPNFHIDEGPFIKYIDVTMPAALAAGSAARDEAARNGRPHGNIFTTTAGKKDERSGKYMYDWITNGAPWNEIFFDSLNRADLIDKVTKNCSGRKVIINATFSHRQLGYTDEWLFKTLSEVGSVGDAADRDFFNVWTSGTQSSPLSTKLNEVIRESEKEVKHHSISKDNYIIRWYIEEDKIEEYMENSYFTLGLDTSDAIGRDGIGGVIMDLRDLSTVAAFTCNETNLIRFANFLADILIKYRNITLVPERKSTGQMIVDNLLLILPKYDIDPFKRIYNTIVDKHNEKKDDYKHICQGMSSRGYDFYDKMKKTFGFTTTGDTRNLLYSTVLQNAAKKAGHLVKDKALSTEIRSLVVKNGRIDHDASGHDDMVIAWLLGHWFVTLTKNLSHYGIDTTKILTAVSNNGKVLSDVEVIEQERNKRVKQQIEDTFESLVNENSSIVILQLENKLKKLHSLLNNEDSEALSLDDLINKVNEERVARGIRLNRNRQCLQRKINW